VPIHSHYLERVIRQRLHQGLNPPKVVAGPLQQQPTRCPHGQSSVHNLLFLQPLERGRVPLAVPERVKAKVSRLPSNLFPPGCRNARDPLNYEDSDQPRGNVLGVSIPQLPEGVRLALCWLVE